MWNIFQGNDLLKNTVAKALGYDADQKYTWFTKDMYFQTFFYLYKRFGQPSLFDEGKEAGAWAFKVKNYIIEIRMNSSWVEFMMYGKKSNHSVHSPYTVKYMRERHKKRDLIISESGNWNNTEKQIADTLFETFLIENNIDKSLSQEQFDKEFGMKWFEKICEYNRSIINVDHKTITELYGGTYHNSYTRHAIRTLNQFLNNMLTPIWIRDVAYNIKGKMSDKDVNYYQKHCNNINYAINKI